MTDLSRNGIIPRPKEDRTGPEESLDRRAHTVAGTILVLEMAVEQAICLNGLMSILGPYFKDMFGDGPR